MFSVWCDARISASSNCAFHFLFCSGEDAVMLSPPSSSAATGMTPPPRGSIPSEIICTKASPLFACIIKQENPSERKVLYLGDRSVLKNSDRACSSSPRMGMRWVAFSQERVVTWRREARKTQEAPCRRVALRGIWSQHVCMCPFIKSFSGSCVPP